MNNTKKVLVDQLAQALDALEEVGKENRVLAGCLQNLAIRSIEFGNHHNNECIEEFEDEVPHHDHADMANMRYEDMSELAMNALEVFFRSARGLRAEVSDDQSLDPIIRREQARLLEITKKYAIKKSRTTRSDKALPSASESGSTAPVTPPKSDTSDTAWTKPQVVEARDTPSPAPRQVAKDATPIAKPIVVEPKTNTKDRAATSTPKPPATPTSSAKTQRKTSSAHNTTSA